MKPRFSNQRNQALTLVEMLVVIAVLAVLAVVYLPTLLPNHNGRQRINCVNDLKKIGLSYLVWADDNGGKYPMGILWQTEVQWN